MLRNAMLGIIAGLVAASAIPAWADDGDGRASSCALTPSVVSSIQSKLTVVVQNGNGGLFTPNRMWSAIVDREGRLCSITSAAASTHGRVAVPSRSPRPRPQTTSATTSLLCLPRTCTASRSREGPSLV